MKLNKLFLAMVLLIVVSSIGIAFAEGESVAGHSFDVPDGYKLLNTTDDMAVLSQDDDHVIAVIFSQTVKSNDDAKSYLESKGYKFIGEEDYNADGKDVSQQNFEKDGFTIFSYVFPAGDDFCIVTLTIPSNETAPEGADNPVTTILDSVK